MSALILVTGAAGKTGREIVSALAARGCPARAFVFRPEQADGVLELGAREAMVGDMLDRAAVERAAAVVTSVYHICPNVHPGEAEIGEILIEAARRAGVGRVVYHSVLQPRLAAMPHHWLKSLVEGRLSESGLPFTILQPCAYMQNLLASWPEILHAGTLRVPYSIDSPSSPVDLLDVAEAAANVLTGPGHEGATYELCGPESLSHAQMAEEIATILGSPVRSVRQDPGEWARAARAAGLTGYPVEALEKMFRWYDGNPFVGSSRDLEQLLGRPPRTFSEFVQRVSP